MTHASFTAPALEAARRVQRLALVSVVALVLAAPAYAQPPADEEGAPPEPGKFTIHFDNVELPTFIKFISKVTGRKFVFSDRISGTVTVISPVPVTESEAFTMFESVLAVRGLTMIEDGVVTRIVPLKEALTSGGGIGAGGGFATRLFPLDHVNADDIAHVLEPLVSKEGSLVPYSATNTIIVSDAPQNLMRVGQVVNALDIPSHEEAVEVIQLKHADAAILAAQLTDILTDTSKPQRASREKGAPARGERDQRFKIVPDERTNSLIVVADPADERRIRALAQGLDTAIEPGEQRIHVYYARYADAVDLVDVLGDMLTGQRRTPTAKAIDARTTNTAGAAAASTGHTASAVGPDVSISADPATNSVIIDASLQDYTMILHLLESLDIQRPQVFVEAIVAEVSMVRSRELGFEFQGAGDIGAGTVIGRTALASLNPLLADPTALTGLIAAAISDKTIELPDGTEVPAQVALFRALATDRDINVLSAPTLLTLDNQEARIVVGENVPFVTSQGVALATANNVFTTVERRDVGIKLTITPQVSEGDVVILDVAEEVSALVENALLDANTVGPTTTIRSAETTVSVQDGRTAVIGGLISNALTRRASKVPLLGDIPILGRLFRSDAHSDEKVNLIVFLTPHVIRNSDDLSRVSDDRKTGFRFSHPEVDVPFPPTGQPYVIPGRPDPQPSGVEPDAPPTGSTLILPETAPPEALSPENGSPGLRPHSS
jgi:general secretion pathway protein D